MMQGAREVLPMLLPMLYPNRAHLEVELGHRLLFRHQISCLPLWGRHATMLVMVCIGQLQFVKEVGGWVLWTCLGLLYMWGILSPERRIAPQQLAPQLPHNALRQLQLRQLKQRSCQCRNLAGVIFGSNRPSERQATPGNHLMLLCLKEVLAL